MLHNCMKTATPCCPERCRTKFNPFKTLACRHEMLDRANQGQYTLDAMKAADRRGDGQPKITSFTCQGYCVQEGMVAESWCQQETLTPRWLSQQDCKIMFRQSQEQDDGTVTKLLFCYQTAWQQRLLHLYGQQMCLLDATYRTCRYSVPLFFLCVRTNVSYSVVGVFVTHSECSADVQEAINVKEWNPSWQPTHFMVDFPEVEIAALEEESPGDDNVWDGGDVETERWRLGNRDWCRCGNEDNRNCLKMPSVRESVCCHDLPELTDTEKNVGTETTHASETTLTSM
ncbi:hypothetical protein Bbelb_316800 [Branchiostoma belcheri]|nr:hypothetical protein Bbelb_316800 [Branchiostoma belcheri]